MKTREEVKIGMSQQGLRARRGEAGFTLAEVLVGVTVMAIVFVAAFMVYDNLQKSFKLSENAATQQQNTRVAFDRMTADIRQAGFNYNPDGNTGRPDEQVEGMWDTAITVRADYDFEDATDSVAPESTLGGASATFDVVSIGNDEIVSYALGKPDGSGGTSISFVADVTGVPRDGTQETVTIGNVHLTQSDPPYTLYRYTVAPNSTAVVKQPVADNIKSLEFTYYSGANDPNTGAPVVLAAVGGGEDPNDIDQRDKISKIGMKVVGMTEDPDISYVDPSDSDPDTQHHRKFALETDVTPRNFDFVGRVDIDLDDPNAPLNFTACQGHCGGTYLTWDHPGDVDISAYALSWGTSASNLTNAVSTTDQYYFVDGISGPHYFTAKSVDLVGNTSARVLLGPTTPADATVPAQVAGAGATGDLASTLAPVDNQVVVSWAGISGNTVDLTCDDTPFPIRDLAGYRVLKGATASFDPNTPSDILQEWDPNTVPATVNSIVDSSVVNCRSYYYKVQGEDGCAVAGAFSATVDGASTTSIPPASPLSVLATDMGLGTHQVSWNTVTENSDSPPATILIDEYAVYRAVVASADDPNQATYTQVYSGAVADPAAPAYQESGITALAPGESYYYKISALDDCPNESALSFPAEAYQCSFGGTIWMDAVPGGDPIVGNQTITINVSGPAVQNTALVIKEKSTGTVVHSQSDATAPYEYQWNPNTVTPGLEYVAIGIVTNVDGCTDVVSAEFTTAVPIACCISPTNPDISPTSGPVSSRLKDVFFDIINNCGEDVEITGIAASFTDSQGSGPLLDEVEYDVFGAAGDNRIVNLNPDLPSIVTMDFTAAPLDPPLDLDAGNDNANPVRLRYTFTQPMLNKVGNTFVGETISSSVRFDTDSGTGQCVIRIVTNPLSILTCDPSSDPNCGL